MLEIDRFEFTGLQCAHQVVHIADILTELRGAAANVADNMRIAAADPFVAEFLGVIDGDLVLVVAAAAIVDLDNPDPAGIPSSSVWANMPTRGRPG